MKHLAFLLLYSLSVYFLVASNVTLGLATDESEVWRYLYFFCLLSLISIPVLTLSNVLLSLNKGLGYKNRLQKRLNLSLIVIVLLVLFLEMSLTPKSNIRVDLILVIPAIILHGITFMVFTFRINKVTKI